MSILSDRLYKPLENLQNFLDKSKTIKEFTLRNSYTIIRDYILSNKLQHEQNSSIIICNINLSRALNTKFFHVLEIKSVILSNMELTREDMNNVKLEIEEETNNRILLNSPKFQPHEIVKVNRQLFKTIFPYSKLYVMTYENLIDNMSVYMLLNKNEVIDQQNQNIIHCHNNPLEGIFKVPILHKDQIHEYILNFIEEPTAISDAETASNNMDQTALLDTTSNICCRCCTII